MSHNSIILNKTSAPKPLVPFTILPSPFQTVIVISAAQHQRAIQKINELDNEIRNAGANLTHIQVVGKKQKTEYSNIIAELIPLYAKINRLIPLYYIVTKNNDIAARNIITMKYLIQHQFIALPDEKYYLRIDELQRHKELLYQLEKYESAIEKLQNSGGYVACKLQYLSSGASTLAKFLSLVEDKDSFGQLSSRVGDLSVPRKFSNHSSNKNLKRNNHKLILDVSRNKKNNIDMITKKGKKNFLKNNDLAMLKDLIQAESRQ